MRTYTPGEVSKLLDIPASSLRRYATLFMDQLSEGAHRKRGRVYNANDVGVFSQVREMTNDGMIIAEIQEKMGDIVIDIVDDDVSDLAVTHLAKELSGHDDRIRSLEQRIAEMENKSFWDRLRGK